MTNSLTIEEAINELPFAVYKNYEHRCSCGNTHIKRHKYILIMKLVENYKNNIPAYRYLLFYQCSDFCIGDSKRYIGTSAGIGEATLQDAIVGLKGVLNNVEY